jgi:hypothetical protein
MEVDEDKRIAFDREKAVFEQNCGQLRTLVQELHKMPLMSATLTGGLVTAMSVFKLEKPYTLGLLALTAVFNAFIGLACIRLRDVIESYIEKASLFSPNFGAKGGRPSQSVLPWFGGFSVAFGYAFMAGTLALAAVAAPFFIFGLAWEGLFPVAAMGAGLGAWTWFTARRRRAAEADPTISYYDRNWKQYVHKTEMLDMADVLDRFAGHLPKNAQVLDVGAGAGRDAKDLIGRGFTVVALEPSVKLARHLRTIPGLAVLEQQVEELEEVARYDGIWACASLLHLDGPRLETAMDRIFHALKPGGILSSTGNG